MGCSKVAIVRTQPATVLADYHRVMNLGGYRDVLDPTADTALKVNISWHFFYPASSTTPWQLEGEIRAMKRDGFDPALNHARTNSSTWLNATVSATCTSTRTKSGSTSATRSAT